MLMRFFKKAEKSKNKIVVPKVCIDKFGREFFLEVYENYIKLVPARGANKNERS